MGRPSLYTDQLADEICRRIADGESMRKVCESADMPDRETVRLWRIANPDFLAKCARAREDQADHEHDEMVSIEADVISGDLDPQAARVVLSSKQWRMSKMAPKVYGDKLDLNHSGSLTVNRVSFADNPNP